MVLFVDGRAVGPAVIARSRWARARGLLGRRSFEGALVFPRTRSIHTVGMRLSIDVACCDEQLTVVRITTEVGPNRMVGPHRGAHVVIEAAAGSFARWRLEPGSRLTIGGSEQ